MSSPEPLDPLLYRVAQVGELLGLSDSKVYRLIKAGQLKAVRIGGVIRIPRESVDTYLASLEPVVPGEDETEAVTSVV